ncbi:hypothetical protein MUK42_04398 [Musa troglodytarum]|uniref:Uncharacterized protein n=1 Tax=Musa troglodytarum TaxID=320322 RepID=A0A9E7KFP5_9LILI|nr:hypothetical protein MUK42_04398 [Musa troglodytarum]
MRKGNHAVHRVHVLHTDKIIQFVPIHFVKRNTTHLSIMFLCFLSQALERHELPLIVIRILTGASLSRNTASCSSISPPNSVFKRSPEFPTTAHVLNWRGWKGGFAGDPCQIHHQRHTRRRDQESRATHCWRRVCKSDRTRISSRSTSDLRLAVNHERGKRSITRRDQGVRVPLSFFSMRRLTCEERGLNRDDESGEDKGGAKEEDHDGGPPARGGALRGSHLSKTARSDRTKPCRIASAIGEL